MPRTHQAFCPLAASFGPSRCHLLQEALPGGPALWEHKTLYAPKAQRLYHVLMLLCFFAGPAAGAHFAGAGFVIIFFVAPALAQQRSPSNLGNSSLQRSQDALPQAAFNQGRVTEDLHRVGGHCLSSEASGPGQAQPAGLEAGWRRGSCSRLTAAGGL